MPTQFEDMTTGEALIFVVYTDPLTILTLVPVTVVMDSPDGTTRHVFRHLNGGTDGVLEDTDRKVRFSKTSTWTAANLSAGPWTVRFLVGDDGTVQDEIGYGIKRVVRPSGGSLPVTN